MVQIQQGISFKSAFQRLHCPGGQSCGIRWECLQSGSIFVLLSKPAGQTPLIWGVACTHIEMQSALHAVLSDEKVIPGPEESLMETLGSICPGLTIKLIPTNLNFLL